MPDLRVVPRSSGPARYELPDIDAAALVAARAIDRLLADAERQVEAASMPSSSREPDPVRLAATERWAGYFRRLPDQLRDDPLPQLRLAARRARAAYGPKDSIRDVFDATVTEPLLDAIDRLLKAIARYEAHRD